MHEAFWNGLFDTRWEDVALGSEAIRLVRKMRDWGYSERTRREYGRAVVHFGRVLHAENGDVNGVLDEAVVDDFVNRHLPVCCCYRRPVGRRQEHVRGGLARLLAMLREEGAIHPIASDTPPYHELLEEHCRFLSRDRGLAETTVTNYRRYLRDFLASRGDAVSPTELTLLTTDDLLAFSRQRGVALGHTAWNHLATSLSGFYRWMDLRGHGGKHMVRAIPLRRRYRLADVPCALSWGQVQRLLAAVDRRELNGHRNYAMLLLFASYGLRGCEVRALCLDDIDWSRDEITVFAPKTGRSRRLPLMRPVGEAILDYLRAEDRAGRNDRFSALRRARSGRGDDRESCSGAGVQTGHGSHTERGNRQHVFGSAVGDRGRGRRGSLRRHELAGSAPNTNRNQVGP